MVSLNGLFKSNQADGIERLLGVMESHAQSDDEQAIRHHIIDRLGGIACCNFSWRSTSDFFASSEQAGCSIFIHGELYNLTPENILAEYLKKGTQFLDGFEFEGVFVGAIYDPKKSRVLIFSDSFGLESLYYYFDEGNFVFSSGIKNIISLPEVKRGIDINALSSFWNFGFPVNNQTPFKDIHLVPAATLICVDLKEWKLSKHAYGHLIDIFNTDKQWRGNIDETIELFKASVDTRSQDAGKNKLGLSLSGGLDSRAVLAALGEKGRHLSTYTLGLEGCADELLAQRMAEACGTDHRFIPIDESALKDFESLARTLIYHSDGQYHPHESTEQVALNYLQTNPFDVMFRGHGGEIGKYSLAYPFQSYKSMENTSSTEYLDHFFNSASLSGRSIEFHKLFKNKTVQDAQSLSFEMLQTSVEPVLHSGISNCDLGIYLYIDQWIRRQVVSSLSIFRTKAGIRLPYLDKKFLVSLLKLEPHQRYSGEFHRALVKKLSPELEQIPDSNTGAPLNAGKLELFVKDKMNSVLRRLSVRGHRHYTEFHDWQRKHFSDAIQQILFSERSMDREYYNKEQLDLMFQLHLTGKKDYSHFFGTAVGIELWHRMFVD